jgi:integrase
LDKPASGYIISVDGKKPVGYDFIRTLYSDKLSTFLGYPKGTLHAHDMRRTHATWLASMGVPLNIIAGKSLGGHRAKGYVGVGWETLDVLHKHYAMLSEDILENLYKQIHLAFMGKTEKIALEVKIDTEMLT